MVEVMMTPRHLVIVPVQRKPTNRPYSILFNTEKLYRVQIQLETLLQGPQLSA
jgi:hypothetical protein